MCVELEFFSSSEKQVSALASEAKFRFESSRFDSELVARGTEEKVNFRKFLYERIK